MTSGMDDAPRTLAGRWWSACKVASWPKVLVPALYGQALGVAQSGSLDPQALAAGLAFCVPFVLAIVWLNDVADARVDALKRRMFPRSSRKTIADGIVSANALLLAGVLAALSAVAVAVFAGSLLGCPAAPLWGLGGLACFFAYSFGPLRLNYRGKGELLEALGVAFVLPAMMFHLQAGRPISPVLVWLVPLWPLALASAIASGLADESSDRAGGKCTVATACGNAAARAWIERLVLLAALALAVLSAATAVVPAPAAALTVAIVLVNYRRLRKTSARARTDAFEAIGRYKRALHHALWRGFAVLALLVALATVWGGR
jgi:1,4-dihydroxy-2-naphthoate octaprenyltransferase/chlorophyll synthase